MSKQFLIKWQFRKVVVILIFCLGIIAPAMLIYAQALPSSTNSDSSVYKEAEGAMGEILHVFEGLTSMIEAKQGECEAIATIVQDWKTSNTDKLTKLMVQVKTTQQKLSSEQANALRNKFSLRYKDFSEKLQSVLQSCINDPTVQAAINSGEIDLRGIIRIPQGVTSASKLNQPQSGTDTNSSTPNTSIQKATDVDYDLSVTVIKAAVTASITMDRSVFEASPYGGSTLREHVNKELAEEGHQWAWIDIRLKFKSKSISINAQEISLLDGDERYQLVGVALGDSEKIYMPASIISGSKSPCQYSLLFAIKSTAMNKLLQLEIKGKRSGVKFLTTPQKRTTSKSAVK